MKLINGQWEFHGDYFYSEDDRTENCIYFQGIRKFCNIKIGNLDVEEYYSNTHKVVKKAHSQGVEFTISSPKTKKSHSILIENEE